MENWEIISIECIDTFDPKIVRIHVKVGPVDYSFDIPSPIYPEIGAAFGWPTNPCTETN